MTIDFERYLKMNRHNPEFRRDFKYVLHQLELARDSNEISHSKYSDLYDRLHTIRTGSYREDVKEIFVKFSTMQRHGFEVLHFDREELNLLIKARSTCSEFCRWADLKQHLPANQYSIEYLRELAQRVINLLKNPEEDLWEELNLLYTSCLEAVARGVAGRVPMKPIAAVLRAGMIYKLKYERSLPEITSTGHMRFFGGEARTLPELPFDLDLVGVELVHLYLTNRYDFEAKATEVRNTLLDLYREGKITEGDYNTFNAKLGEYTYLTLESISQVRNFEPLVRFQWCKDRGRDVRLCLFYSDKHIEKAIDFARQFYGSLRNEFLIEEMILRKLNVDLPRFDNDERVKRALDTSLENALEAFRDFNIISTEEYMRYNQYRKEKFS